MKEFGKWLEAQLKARGLKPADLTHEARVGSGTVYNILNGNRKPGPDTLSAIARVLQLPPEDVFRQAGLLPPKPDIDAEAGEMLHLFQQLDAEQRKMALQTLRAWLAGG